MQFSYSTNKNSKFLGFTFFLRFLIFAHEENILGCILRKVRERQKSIYLFALIPCLRNLLQLETLYSAEPAESTLLLCWPINSWQQHTMQEISSNPFLYQLAEYTKRGPTK